jgi:hypothetical protein
MKITSDRDRYDELQAALVGRIEEAVRGHLRLLLEGRVPPNLGEVTNDIVFTVTNVLDGTDGEAGSSGRPVLTFATSEARNELIVADPGEGSRTVERCQSTTGAARVDSRPSLLDGAGMAK